MKKVILSAAVMTAFLSSCGNAGKTVDLAGEWNIVSVEGQQVTSEEDPFLGFDMKDGRLYGNAGCNSIMAQVAVDSAKNTIELTQVGATRRMCQDMQLEQKVLAALEKVSGYQASANGVELTDSEGTVIFGLEKKEAPAVSADDLNGEWIISKVEGKIVEAVEKTPFVAINVADKTVHGTGGCNIFNGSFSQEENQPASFRFGELATTMMAGPGMEQEGIILPALGKVRSFAVQADGTISLMDEKQKEVVVLTKNTGKSLSE